MDDKKYYDFLNHGIEWAGKPNVNGQGFITFDGIPFYHAGDAVKYIMKHFPEAEPKDKLIREDKKACKLAALGMLREVQRLLEMVETAKDTAFNETSHKAEQRDSIPGKNILEDVEKKRLHEEVEQGIGRHSGLSEAWSILHSRKFELWNCSRL